MEHKIEFEKLKEPEDQLAMESVRSNFEKKPLQFPACRKGQVQTSFALKPEYLQIGCLSETHL